MYVNCTALLVFDSILRIPISYNMYHTTCIITNSSLVFNKHGRINSTYASEFGLVIAVTMGEGVWKNTIYRHMHTSTVHVYRYIRLHEH